MKTELVIINNEDADTCKKCGGECCKRMPGIYHPSQFGPNLEGVEELLRSRKAAIDWWEGPLEGYEETSYYLRPATKYKPGSFRSVGHPFDASWGGECVLLTPNGCPLPFADRPWGCQALKPNPDVLKDDNARCSNDSGVPDKRLMALAWQPFAVRLAEIGRKVDDEN